MGCDIHAFLEVKIRAPSLEVVLGRLQRIAALSAGTEPHANDKIHALCTEALEDRSESAWQLYGEVDFSRDYELFEKMAGVRGERSAALAAPRGLPSDAGTMTRFQSDNWGGDGHSHSWLSSGEMQALDEWHKARPRIHSSRNADHEGNPRSLYTHPHAENLYLFGNDIEAWWRWPKERPKHVLDIRLVFWFDN